MDPRRVRPAHRGDVGAGSWPFRLPGDPFGVAGAEPVQGRQERPLVVVRFEGAEVEERGQPMPAAADALQRRGDEIAETALGQDVLAGEQPVVGPQVHRPAQHHRLVQQGGTDGPRHRCCNRGGEEDPHVGAASGLGDLQRGRHRTGPRRLDVGEGVEHRRWTVEVGHQEMAGVVGQQRIQPDEHIADEMGGDDLGGTGQVSGATPVHALAPATGDGGYPPGGAGAGVLPPHGVYVGAGPEPVIEKRQFVSRRRVHRDQPRRGDRCGQLLRGRSRVLTAQVQQTRQSGVLRP